MASPRSVACWRETLIGLARSDRNNREVKRDMNFLECFFFRAFRTGNVGIMATKTGGRCTNLKKPLRPIAVELRSERIMGSCVSKWCKYR